MASICCPFWVPSISKSSNPNRTSTFTKKNTIQFRTKSSWSTTEHDATNADEASLSIDNLKRFFNLNLGNWSGSFHQFDGNGNLMQNVNTKLAVTTYGENELIIIQTYYDQGVFGAPYWTKLGDYTGLNYTKVSGANRIRKYDGNVLLDCKYITPASTN